MSLDFKEGKDAKYLDPMQQSIFRLEHMVILITLLYSF